MNIIFERNSEYDKLFGTSGVGFDCLRGQKVIGRFCVFKGQSWVSRRQEVYIEVTEESRGKGYGKDIYLTFIEKAVKLGFKNHVFYAVTFDKNEASKRLCESLGFKKIPFWAKKVSVFKFRSVLPSKS